MYRENLCTDLSTYYQLQYMKLTCYFILCGLYNCYTDSNSMCVGNLGRGYGDS